MTTQPRNSDVTDGDVLTTLDAAFASGRGDVLVFRVVVGAPGEKVTGVLALGVHGVAGDDGADQLGDGCPAAAESR
ncbi:hypothetical protein [Streptomyces sp. NPDC047973]|uniref:hypothetical protein n=1 Tax=Streptomyces sp. NPDC047973 TaxID=3155383 RepID=UPI00342248DB